MLTSPYHCQAHIGQSGLQRNRLASVLARILPATLLAAGGAACSLPAGAAISDTISPFIATSYSYDDNLFRIDDNVPGFDGQRSDTSRQVQAGFRINRPIGRQLLTGQVKWSRVYFDHFDQLDYTGKDYLADLEWHIANHLEGHLGASYAQTLTPFSDLRSSERNLRTIRREYANGGWRFHPSWRVRGDSHAIDIVMIRLRKDFPTGKKMPLNWASIICLPAEAASAYSCAI